MLQKMRHRANMEWREAERSSGGGGTPQTPLDAAAGNRGRSLGSRGSSPCCCCCPCTCVPVAAAQAPANAMPTKLVDSNTGSSWSAPRFRWSLRRRRRKPRRIAARRHCRIEQQATSPHPQASRRRRCRSATVASRRRSASPGGGGTHAGRPRRSGRRRRRRVRARARALADAAGLLLAFPTRASSAPFTAVGQASAHPSNRAVRPAGRARWGWEVVSRGGKRDDGGGGQVGRAEPGGDAPSALAVGVVPRDRGGGGG